jgi:hypothetical protein
VLVLIVTLNSALSYLIKKEEVFLLFRRTIRFLRLYEDLSPLLEYNRSVLEHIQARLLGTEGTVTNTFSTSSNTNISHRMEDTQ